MSIQRLGRSSILLFLAALNSGCSLGGECGWNRSSCMYEGKYEEGEEDYAEDEAKRLNKNSSDRLRRSSGFAPEPTPPVVAIPVAGHALLRQIQKGRIASKNRSIGVLVQQGQARFDVLQDFNDVFAAELHHERHNPRLGRPCQLLNLALAYVAVMVA
ncbi:hypothetical protein G6F57_015641 [Rhizopus arrhizus]|nr:hypothetical protein G6F57_015641 [Rhizopus arrhizus]